MVGVVLPPIGVARADRPAVASCCISETIVATPETVCDVSVANPTSRWLSPPNGMWTEMTGETFIWMRVMAARICEAAVLSAIDPSASSRLWLMLRTCCCEVTSPSTNACCAGLAPFL